MRSLLPTLNLALAILLAPLLGLLLIIGFSGQHFSLDLAAARLPITALEEQIDEMDTAIISIQRSLTLFSQQANREKGDFETQKAALEQLIARSEKQASTLPALGKLLYERNLATVLGGELAYAHHSATADIKIFSVHGTQYRGYLAKITAYQQDAFAVTMAKNGKGTRETTSSAAKRNHAILAINGGGFYPAKQGGKTVHYPLGNTMIDGQLLDSFVPSFSELFFAGFNKQGELIGNYYNSFERLQQEQPQNGVSFLPILLKDGEKMKIPNSWKNRRQPRTIIGVLKNGDIFFLVIDGRQANWSRGITLEDAQELLLRVGALDAYNLDGGGSTTMVYNNQVLNRPSGGSERAVTTHILVRP